jgi:hypothetical protein
MRGYKMEFNIREIKELDAFANLIEAKARADEREQCAKIAMDMPTKADSLHTYRSGKPAKAVAWDISIAIKKRGE